MDIIEKSLDTLEFDLILHKLSDFAKLNQSKNLCLSLLPFLDKTDIKEQIRYTKEAKAYLDKAIELPIEQFSEIKEIKEGYISAEELINFAKIMKVSRLLKNLISQNSEKCSLLYVLVENLFSNKEFEERIFNTFDLNLNVKKDASKELSRLYSSLNDNEKNLKDKVSELLNNATFSKHLQENIYTLRDERVVFQVKASSKSKIDGIVHDVSASNQSFYIEPSILVPLNNKIREIKVLINKEIINILTGLTTQIKDKWSEIEHSEKIVAMIDFYFAKARYAIHIDAVEPELIDTKEIIIDGMRHPLLIDTLDKVVKNDFKIGNDYKSVIITGSNTGGKTVVIKTVGLFILMAKSGLFLPCDEAKIFPFEKIFADIGDEQSISQSLSTFSSHMNSLIEILNNSDEDTFVVIDEICAGTDPVEGAILAEVILEELAKIGTLSCITTHFGQLKGLEFNNNYFKNACVEFDVNTLKPTYKLIIGIPGLSNAISISANLGLSQSLIEKAREILNSQKDPSIMVVEKLQHTQLKLSENLKEAEEIKEDSMLIKKTYEAKLSDLRKDKKKTLKTIQHRLDDEIVSAKDEIKSILDELRHEKSEKIARRSYSRLAKLEKQIKDDIASFNEEEKYQELNWQNIKIGDKVLLKNLNQPVILLSLPDKNQNATVQMGLIKTKIKMDKLAICDETKIPKVKLKLTPKEAFSLDKFELSNTLDLRGYRVEEALDATEYFLDRASLANLSPVYIIHGHGTGALKSAITDFLSTSPYVAKYRFGEPAEGRDGVSVVDVN